MAPFTQLAVRPDRCSSVSDTLIRLVLKSGLPAGQKLTAVVLADFGWHDGSNIFPSLERVAETEGRTLRHVRRNVQALVALGVLVPLRSRKGGGRPNEYRLDASKLPPRDPWSSRRQPGQPGSSNPDISDDLPVANPDIFDHPPVANPDSQNTEGGHSRPATRTTEAVEGVRNVRRSVSDPLVDPLERNIPASPDVPTPQKNDHGDDLARLVDQRIVVLAKQILQLDFREHDTLTAEIVARLDGDDDLTTVAAGAGLTVAEYVRRESLICWTGFKHRCQPPVPVAAGTVGC